MSAIEWKEWEVNELKMKIMLQEQELEESKFQNLNLKQIQWKTQWGGAGILQEDVIQQGFSLQMKFLIEL